MKSKDLEKIFDDAINRLKDGDSIDEILCDFSAHKNELEELLNTYKYYSEEVSKLDLSEEKKQRIISNFAEHRTNKLRGLFDIFKGNSFIYKTAPVFLILFIALGAFVFFNIQKIDESTDTRIQAKSMEQLELQLMAAGSALKRTSIVGEVNSESALETNNIQEEESALLLADEIDSYFIDEEEISELNRALLEF